MPTGDTVDVRTATVPVPFGQVQQEPGKQFVAVLPVLGRLHVRSPPEGDSPMTAPQLPQGPKVPHPGRRVAEPQSPGDLAVGKVLEVAHQQDLAIRLVEPFNRLLKSALEFVADRHRGGRQLVVSEVGGQVDRRPIAEGRRGHRPFAIDAPAPRDAVLAVLVDQVVARDVPQPEVERHRRLAQILGQAAARLQQDPLDHVAGIDPAADRAVHPHLDHPPQGLAMLGQ